MTVAFYIAAAVAVASTVLVITRTNAVHALLYLVVSFLSSGLMFYVLGAPFAAALEVIIYAGAIMVLFLFAVMLLNVARGPGEHEREWMRPRAWILPVVLVVILLTELVYLAASGGAGAADAAGTAAAQAPVGPKQVGVALFGPYVLGVELASVLLLAGLVGAHRLTREEE